MTNTLAPEHSSFFGYLPTCRIRGQLSVRDAKKLSSLHIFKRKYTFCGSLQDLSGLLEMQKCYALWQTFTEALVLVPYVVC